MIRTAVLTRGADGKAVLLQVQIHNGNTEYKELTRYELVNLISQGMAFLAEDEADVRT